jgi:hypothetical protein
MNKNNIELHWYLWLDRRQRHKCDAQVNTSQREQYRGTVPLFIGTGRSLCDITFMSFTTGYNHDTNYHRSIGLFILSQCNPSSQGASLCRSSLGGSFDIASMSIFRRCFLLTGPSVMKQTPNSSPFAVLDHFS